MAERVAATLKLGEDANFFRPRSVSVLSAVKGIFSRAPSPGDEGRRRSPEQGGGHCRGERGDEPAWGIRV